MSESAEHLKLVEEPEAPKPPADPLIGTTVDGRYEIVAKLGEGGMGVVYHTKHVVLQKDLAMKVLRADVSKDQEIITRFRQEAQSASAIGSQHIIDISDFGQLVEGSTYFIMEYLAGQELTNIVEDEKSIPTERLVFIAKQLCDALGAAHDAGIVHRDMKPDNVFLIKRGGTEDFVKVLDFGIAKVGGASSKLTKAGQVFGTPHYMSPEQCSGQGVDSRTDIYAVGVILYEMACGKVPFDADNLMGILTKHIYEQPIPLHQLPPPTDVPAGLEAVILKCLAKSKEQRYQTMAEVKADLEAFEAGSTPRAVIDQVDPTGAHRLGADGTGAHGALAVGVGGEYKEEGGSKLPLLLGGLVGLVALLGVGLAVYFLVLAPGEVEPDPVAVTPPEPEPEPEPDPEPVQEPVPEMAEEPTPEQVQLNIVSEPEGVEVWVGEEGQATLIGNTPLQIPRPAQGDVLTLTLKRSGFQDHQVRVGFMTQPEVLVTLRAEEQRPTGRRGTGRRRPAGTTTPPAETVATPPPVETPPVRNNPPRGDVLDPWAN
ncbi:MAG: serine/threonine protein kinase [Sandaracinaceae bacterium]